MDAKDTNPFQWRNEGKQFKLGDEDDIGVTAMISTDDSMLFVLRKSIHSVRLADSVDPDRTNPAIPDIKQKILSFGSNDPFVGRTLLQANTLFAPNCLDERIDCTKALSIALSFLKEIIALREMKSSYIAEDGEKNSSFVGKTGEDSSLNLPSMDKVEQQTKQFIINTDHAVRHIIELTQLFYPEIKSGGWAKLLLDKLKQERGADNPCTQFVESINPPIWLTRNLRNAIEHPTQSDKVLIQNYRLLQTGKVKPPTISYEHPDANLSEIPVSQFMSLSLENIVICFEELMVHFCNIHAAPFAGDTRSVVEIPETARSPHETHVRFGYQIAWTK